YKANRRERPDDFNPQEDRILRIVRDAGVPIFGKPGFEADDLIATMTRKLCDSGWDIYLVSKDKDLRQILNDCTYMYDVQKDEVIDSKKMEEKVGYSPAEAIEVQTLMGDTIDNVPGIPGVGEKTAAKLIKKYHKADDVLKHLDELTPKMRENFEKYAERLPISRQLVTLKTDVDIEFDPENCVFTGLNVEALKPHLTELGFTSLLKRLGMEEAERTTTATVRRAVQLKPAKFEEGLFAGIDIEADQIAATAVAERDPSMLDGDGLDYQLIDTDDKFEAFLEEIKKQKRFAFDTETTSLDPVDADLIGMSFSWKAGTGYYVPVRGPAGCAHIDCDRVLESLKPILENPKIKKVGHNLKYDMLVMRVSGIELRGIEMDSMVAAFLIDPTRLRYGIDELARELLNFRKMPTADLIGKGKHQITMDRVELERVARYASEDADIALRLADMLKARLEELPTIKKLHDELELLLIDVLAEMEFNGVAIDENILKEQSEVLGQRIEELRKQIMDCAGCEFNPDSPKQLGEVLFVKLGLRIIKKNKTGPSTDVEVLEKLSIEHPVPKLVLEYRSLVKLKNTYLDNLTTYVSPRDHRIHTSFNQTGAETGRLSSSDPNLQNIPIRTDEGRRIRLAFIPGDPKNNVLVTADYSQIELRVLAHFTQEPALMEAFERDEDIHQAVAAEVFNVPLNEVTKAQRGQAKTINFGIIYGVSAYGLARRIDNLTVRSAQDLIDAYNKRFPRIAQFMDQCVMHARTEGYVETIRGRRRPIPDINSQVLAIRNASERMAINSVVQGSAADLIKVAMLNIHRRMKKETWQSKLLLQVHDELVFETPAKIVESEAEMIRHEMTTAMKLSVPLKVEIGWGKNWQEGK
ncbi:MAG TPA: DNA polymerase I, partial [Tepidisphaeraceae bacterium]|nr:DNA polymerase I [Tepidisphaeraceae bacterium]